MIKYLFLFVIIISIGCKKSEVILPQDNTQMEQLISKMELDFIIIEQTTARLDDITESIYPIDTKVIYKPLQKYQLNSDKTYWAKENDKVKSELWVSGFIAIDKELKALAHTTEKIDSALVQSTKDSEFIVQSYYNSKESLNRIYPPINAPTQFQAKLNIPSFNFYYEADEKHNPQKNTIWVKDAYVDPAGRGWMISCISPVYYQDKLKGVVGVDVTLETLLKKYDFETARKDYFIIQENGNVILASESIGEILSLPSFKEHSYFETIKQNTFAPDKFNLQKSPLEEIRNLFSLISEKKQLNIFEYKLKGKKFLVKKGHLKKLNWIIVELTKM